MPSSGSSFRSRGFGSRKSIASLKYKGRGKRGGSFTSSLGSRTSARSLASKKTKVRSLTKSMSKLTTEKIKTDGTMSSSYYHWKMKGARFGLGKFKKLTATQFYVTNTTLRLAAGAGLQGIAGFNGAATAIPALYSSADLIAMFTQASTMTAVIPGTTGPTAAFIPNPKTQKVYHSRVMNEIMFTNQTNDVMHVMIYECMARRDVASASYSNPGVAWAVGNTDEGNTNTYQVVGSSPFQAPGFTEFYKVQKVIDVNLHSGAHHVHRSQANPKKMFSDEILQSTGATSAIAGLTCFHLVVIHGYPYNAAADGTAITTAPVFLDLIWRKQYEFYVVEKSGTTITVNNTLPGSVTAGQIQSDVVNAITPITSA